MEFEYIESQYMTVQGKASDIYKRYGKTWTIRPLGKGNGNWLLTRKSDVLVNGVSYRENVLGLYGKTKLTRNLFDRFCKDVENGEVNI